MVAVFPLQTAGLAVHTLLLHVAVGASQYWLVEQVEYSVLDSPLVLHVRSSLSWQNRAPGTQTMAMQVAFTHTWPAP